MKTLEMNFPTIFGRELLEETKGFVHTPFLIVTMEDLWPQIERKIGDAECKVYFVKSTDESFLLDELKTISSCNCQAIVGIGGGQALDVAKFFTWKTHKPLFQFPTILSVDAMFGQRSAIRNSGRVSYKGWAIPEAIFFDYDIIKAAPAELNYSGIGDILCFHTGALDWQYAHSKNKCHSRWQFNQDLVDISLQKVENLIKNKHEVKMLSDKGIECIVDAFKWGGLSYFGSGWCPCHVEGMEHFFFYTLEYLTGKKFLHGKPVCLGVYIGSMLHNNRADEMLDTIIEIGLDIRPETMNVTWDDIGEAMGYMKKYVHEQNLWFSIAHDTDISDEFVQTIKENVINKYKNFK